MDARFKTLEEEQYKPPDDLFDYSLPEKGDKNVDDKDDHELKFQEESYQSEYKKLLEELGQIN